MSRPFRLITEGRVMEWGPIPPAGGPHRDRFLETNGIDALNASRAAYAKVVELLGDKSASMPVMHEPYDRSDDALRRAVQLQKAQEWDEFWIELDPALLRSIEPRAREAEAFAVAALNFLEDHELADEAHHAVHEAGFVRRGLFGCPIVLRGDDFWTNCPVDIAHCRGGMSAGFVADFECSICGRLVEDCDHQMGAAYPRTAAQTDDGTCSICDATQCEHAPGAEYVVVASSKARSIVTEEVSYVSRPRYPQARFIAWTTDLGDADTEEVREAAQQGLLHCDICLGPCDGLNELPDDFMSRVKPIIR